MENCTSKELSNPLISLMDSPFNNIVKHSSIFIKMLNFNLILRANIFCRIILSLTLNTGLVTILF